MAVKSSGTLSFNTDIVGEFGGSTPHSLSEYYGVDSGVPSSGTIAFSDFYGASNVVTASGGSTINGQTALQQIRTSNYISSGGTFEIPSNYWIWSDNTGVAALIIDTPNATVVNRGKIIGRGGNGGWRSNGYAGGPAIQVTASGVTISNVSGAYIAGGGGGGGGSTKGTRTAGGGGGAGGGRGGPSASEGSPSQYINWLAGGSINAVGPIPGNVDLVTGNAIFIAGGAGGAGGFARSDQAQTGGGSGGRILPGSGGSRPSIAYTYQIRDDGNKVMYGNGNGGAGGSAGTSSSVSAAAGGGGGWGAAGGNGDGRGGGAGGAAVSGSYTRGTWSGTVYGSS